VTLRDRVERRWVPRAIVAASQVSWPGRLDAAARRAAGRHGRVELFFAFDDPCSAVAVLDIAERLAGRPVILRLTPVVVRGPRDDPATAAKRRYAVTDARRLARRLGLELGRTEPLPAGDTAFLAAWTAGAPHGPARRRFCSDALTRLWFTDDEPVRRAAYADLWPGDTRPSDDDAPVRAAERRMRRRGPYDTPAAVIGRRWYFAHDRPAQIAGRLDELGWT
jgi:2-hydroxychromene-2-carboxylate isomerase